MTITKKVDVLSLNSINFTVRAGIAAGPSSLNRIVESVLTLINYGDSMVSSIKITEIAQ